MIEPARIITEIIPRQISANAELPVADVTVRWGRFDREAGRMIYDREETIPVWARDYRAILIEAKRIPSTTVHPDAP